MVKFILLVLQVRKPRPKEVRGSQIMVFSSRTDPVEGGVMASKDVHVLISATREYSSALCEKRDSAELIKLRIFRWEDYSGL